MFASSTPMVLVALFLAGCLAVNSQTTAEKDIAAKYSPIFHEALGDDPRADYPTNFNFDGDWDGTNNWQHADDKTYKLNAYIYYAMTETATHYFITYAVFHARDYKGGDKKGIIYSDLLRNGAKILSKGQEPTGLLAEAAIAHENDMEGALVVVDKSASKVAFVESLHHNSFSRYTPDGSPLSADGHFKSVGDHVELYIEPKGHGIEAWGTEGDHPEKGYLLYSYAGRADDPEKATDGKVRYDLLAISTTLWPKARTATKNTTFASFKDYGTFVLRVVSAGKTIEKKVVLGTLASAFDGTVGGVNMARPPWGWFSNDHSKDAAGLWFFDPATIVKRDFALPESFSVTYLKVPFWASSGTSRAARAGT